MPEAEDLQGRLRTLENHATLSAGEARNEYASHYWNRAASTLREAASEIERLITLVANINAIAEETYARLRSERDDALTRLDAVEKALGEAEAERDRLRRALFGSPDMTRVAEERTKYTPRARSTLPQGEGK